MIHQVTPAHFRDWMAQQSAPVVVIDVREAWELQTTSVKAEGFTLLHIPLHTLPARLADVPKDASIACLCHHGGRSQQAAHFLSEQGFAPMANIAGGIHAWSAQCDPSIPVY